MLPNSEKRGILDRRVRNFGPGDGGEPRGGHGVSRATQEVVCGLYGLVGRPLGQRITGGRPLQSQQAQQVPGQFLDAFQIPTLSDDRRHAGEVTAEVIASQPSLAAFPAGDA